MNKKKMIIIVIAITAVALSIFFISNMIGNKNLVEAPSIEEPSETDKEKDSPEQHPTLSQIMVGELAPDFSLTNLEGQEVKLSDYRGKLVFLNFWATWCPPCAMEMPDLQALNADNDDLVVLALSVREDKNTVKPYLEEGGYDFPVLLDQEGEIAGVYLVGGFPTTFFINSQGELLNLLYSEDIFLDRYPGMMEKEQMQEILEKMRDLEN